jgi:hypothetical protein
VTRTSAQIFMKKLSGWSRTLLLFLWVVPHRFRCLEYLWALIIFPHFGHVGMVSHGWNARL